MDSRNRMAVERAAAAQFRALGSVDHFPGRIYDGQSSVGVHTLQNGGDLEAALGTHAGYQERYFWADSACGAQLLVCGGADDHAEVPGAGPFVG